MLGDDMRDINAGKNAGCIPVFIGPPERLQSSENENISCFPNLLSFICFLQSNS